MKKIDFVNMGSYKGSNPPFPLGKCPWDCHPHSLRSLPVRKFFEVLNGFLSTLVYSKMFLFMFFYILGPKIVSKRLFLTFSWCFSILCICTWNSCRIPKGKIWESTPD